MLEAVITGEHNGGKSAQVSDYNTLRVTPTDAEPQPIGTASRLRYYSKLLGSTGADSGITNMAVDGSITPQEFYIGANPDYDLRIMAIVIVLADQTVQHNSFGGVPVGTMINGWNLEVIEAGETTAIINTARTSGQIIAQAGFGHPYGADATSFQLTKWTANDDAHTILIPVHSYIKDGIRIGRGTKDKIISTVQDNVSGNTEFTIRLIGNRHYP